ncbi:hypothetical protein PCAR4_200017 [Paraburkholderia caribensis]|nr:hypothetical protein PCAR4_200017 [Paraburkholderia caribensis]
MNNGRLLPTRGRMIATQPSAVFAEVLLRKAVVGHVGPCVSIAGKQYVGYVGRRRPSLFRLTRLRDACFAAQRVGGTDESSNKDMMCVLLAHQRVRGKGDGIEQPENSGDDLLLPGSLLAHATGFVAQELLVIVQVAVEGLDATLGDEPEFITYGAQQGAIVTDQHHRAFEFVERHA